MITAANKLIHFQSLQIVRFSQLSNGVRSYQIRIIRVCFQSHTENIHVSHH